MSDGPAREVLEVQSELRGGAAHLTPVGELDIATAPQFEQEVRSLLGRCNGQVVIDLSRLTFIDSSALRLFVVLSEQAVSEGWTLRLLRPKGQVRSVFQITGADENLPFMEDGGDSG